MARLVVLSCALPALVACVYVPTVERQVEYQTLEFHTSCLSVVSPAYSKAHTDCVLARYEERQHELDRLRERVKPPPPPFPAFQTVPDAEPGSYYMI